MYLSGSAGWVLDKRKGCIYTVVYENCAVSKSIAISGKLNYFKNSNDVNLI